MNTKELAVDKRGNGEGAEGAQASFIDTFGVFVEACVA